VSSKVTAIIPTYNYARFLPRAIDSVLAQTYAPIEVLVVDDGSTDDTPEVLARYGERVRVMRLQNGGVSRARNTGIGAARTDFVAMLDADDWWDQEKIARQMALLEREPSLSIVGCGIRWSGPTHPIVEWRAPLPQQGRAGDLRAIATRRFMVGGSNSGLLARRRLFDEVGLFDTALFAAEDWDMWLRIGAEHGIGNVPEPLTNIYVHGEGRFRNAARVEESQWRVYEKAVRAWPDVLDGKTRRQMRALILADAGGELVDAGNVEGAFRKYWASLFAWPLPLFPMRYRPTLSVTAKLARQKLQAAAGGGGNK
jgi:glycosyltransferase involved in cell wall biosynthesis